MIEALVKFAIFLGKGFLTLFIFPIWIVGQSFRFFGWLGKLFAKLVAAITWLPDLERD